MKGTKFLVFILLATVQRSHVDADRYVFASDAAGRRPPGATELTGAASIGYLNKKKKHDSGANSTRSLSFTWPGQNNSATYEMVGLLPPTNFLHKHLKHQEVCLLVDNEAKIWS